MKTATLKVHVTDVTRVGASEFGNPTMRVHTAGHGDFLTEVDAMVGYAADNFRPRHHLGQSPRSVTLTLTPDRRIVNMEDA